MYFFVSSLKNYLKCWIGHSLTTAEAKAFSFQELYSYSYVHYSITLVFNDISKELTGWKTLL
jgi:hypothetical protein